MKKAAIFCTIILLAVACNRKPKVIIKGHIEGLSKDMMYLNELQVAGSHVIDSVKTTSSGKFRFSFRTDKEKFYQLTSNQQQFISLLASPGNRIVVDSDTVNFTEDYSVRGSEDSRKLKELNDQLVKDKSALDSIEDLYKKSSANGAADSVLQKFNEDYNKIYKDHKKFLIRFILENTSSLASIAAVYQQLNSNTYFLNSKRDIQYFKILNDSLTKYHPGSPHVKALQKNFNDMMAMLNNARLEQLMQSGAKSGLPEIALPDVNGDTVRLSSVLDKYVLLSFWSAADRESMLTNLDLIDAYKKFGGKKFEIYQVSLDQSAEDWGKLMKKANYPWISVIDVNGEYSVAARSYNVQKLPTSYLLSPDGDILLKNPTIETLNSKLKEVIR
ncbi:MAG TPA: TlpA disulfide reductase family protein [Bacteroidales bacterium]|nr:TlpA disulfide reductase family protein [Bacteroidales bacterium]